MGLKFYGLDFSVEILVTLTHWTEDGLRRNVVVIDLDVKNPRTDYRPKRLTDCLFPQST